MKATIKLAMLLLAAGLGLDARAQTQSIYAVDDTATGANDGSSWADAFTQLQEALYVAQPGDWILVAEGIYAPNWDPVNNVVTGKRSDTFQLENGVVILGGFPNGGGVRDPKTHLTGLTGSISFGGQLDTYHVVTAGPGGNGYLDGFVVSIGQADGPYPHDRGAGILILGSSPTLRDIRVQYSRAIYGGGIYIENGSPILQDVTIVSNHASLGGAGMWNQGGSPHLTGVLFVGNISTGPAGGLLTVGGAPHIENSWFVQNTGTSGGGLSIVDGSLTLDNVGIIGNAATSDRGGGILTEQAQLLMNNVTLNANAASQGGGGIYMYDPGMVTARNSIIWGNTGGNVGGALLGAHDSLIQGGYPGSNILTADPLFRVPGTDLRLNSGSPAIGAGDPSTCAATDIRGMLRDDACDMGVYEYLGTTGTYWSNGEVDLLLASPSYDATPDGGDVRLSADDFLVPPQTVCNITSIRGVLQDGTMLADATLTLQQHEIGPPGTGTVLAAVHAHCANNPASTCSDSSECPGSECILPGKLLGARDGEMVWEPRFDFSPGYRLGWGHHWISMHGTVEAGGAGLAYALSAGDGAIRGMPYFLCGPGATCASGGPALGDVPRDLALDVDALCEPDVDGDLSGASEDCDESNPNRFPGNPEICDGIDNDCNLIADTGAAPTASPTLTMTRTQLSWNAVANAAGYDVVRGRLDELRSTGGDFTHSGCNENDVAGTFFDIGNGIPQGLGVWYVIRAASPCGNTTYNDGSPSQVQSRDPGIAASGNACP